MKRCVPVTSYRSEAVVLTLFILYVALLLLAAGIASRFDLFIVLFCD